MKNNKRIIAVIALVAVLAIFLGVYFATQPGAVLGPKAFTVTVVHADGSEKVFTYDTTAKKLGGFLEEQGLIGAEGMDPGMFHTVDGEKADWNENQSYWAFYLGEEYATTGIYDTFITNNAVYRLVYTIGF